MPDLSGIGPVINEMPFCLSLVEKESELHCNIVIVKFVLFVCLQCLQR